MEKTGRRQKVDDIQLLEKIKELWLRGFGSRELMQLYKDGVADALKEIKEEIKDLKNDIEHTGFDKEHVLLCLEDWLAK